MEWVHDQVRSNCHDCKAKVGEHHGSGCDTEQCPKCGGQLIGCDCFRIGEDGFDQKEFEKYEQEKWSGIMFEDAKLFAEQNNLFVYFKDRWIECDVTHPEATHDINTAIMKMPEFIPKYKMKKEEKR